MPAPISGRIGLSNVTEGALVTANQADALTTITRLDPVYVDIQESAADLLALRRALTQGGAVPTIAQVRLKLPDGSDYGFTGHGRIQRGASSTRAPARSPCARASPTRSRSCFPACS